MTIPQLGKSRTIAYNYGLNNAAEGAADWLCSNGIPPKGRACVSSNADALTIESCDVTALFALFAGL
jgi:hypothetical protein